MFDKHRLKRLSARILRDLASASLVAFIATPAFTVSAAAQTQSTLTLDEAVSQALAANPSLRAAGAGVDAAQGGVRQARARINPELSAEVENFGGRDDLRGLSGAESTFSLSQELELGGRRGARVGLADRELHGAELDRVLRGLDLARDVQTAFYDALAAREMVGIARERLKTAEVLNSSVARRVAAARDPLMAGARAEAGLAEARTALDRAIAEAATAQARLASLMGVPDASLDPSHFALPVATDHSHAALGDSSPDIARLIAERDKSSAAVRVERSLSWQNPTLSLGYRRFEDRNGDGALVAGFSVPLGIFDRNRGSIARARAEEQRADFEVEAGRRAIALEYASLHRSIMTEADQIRAIETKVIPQAERALALAQSGYDRGAFSYLDVLDAQRALTDARQSRVESLKSFHNSEAALDRLTARFASVLPFEEQHQ